MERTFAAAISTLPFRFVTIDKQCCPKRPCDFARRTCASVSNLTEEKAVTLRRASYEPLTIRTLIPFPTLTFTSVSFRTLKNTPFGS